MMLLSITTACSAALSIPSVAGFNLHDKARSLHELAAAITPAPNPALRESRLLAARAGEPLSCNTDDAASLS